MCPDCEERFKIEHNWYGTKSPGPPWGPPMIPNSPCDHLPTDIDG
jgi:hypothetical protein